MSVNALFEHGGHARCPSFVSFKDVLLISCAIPLPICVNSDLVSPLCESMRCFSALLAGWEDRVRIESTQERNSLVRSWFGILLCRY